MSDTSVVTDDRPDIDPYPLSPYVAWGGRRNRDPILAVFKKLFPSSGNVLEIASGSGMHINYLAPHFPQIRFQPSDMNEDVFESIRKNTLEQGNANVADPTKLDLTNPETWPIGKDRFYDIVFAINIFQVAPVSIANGIFEMAARILDDSGRVMIYGPFKVDGNYPTQTNEDFDKEILATKVPGWGLKNVGDLEKSAKEHGLVLKEKLDLPANNFILIFSRQ
jgi:cyclopropane fatty-acyl-phospholipid synthase-like methyltransferase